MTKGDFYRICREWHGYLSAIAFLALILFAGTGILLNHPGLLEGQAPEPLEASLVLSEAELSAIATANDPASALAETVASHTRVTGAFRSGEVIGDDVYVNMVGVRGRSDITANLETGAVDVYTDRESLVGVLNGLHRAEHAGDAWRLFVDIIAVVFIVMALIGFALFLSLRFRVRRAMAIMAVTLVATILLFVFATS